MKVSSLQIFWMIFTFETGNMLLLSIGPAIKIADQNVWISYLIATICGIVIVTIATKVGLLYPKQSFVEYSQIILGKWIGKLIILIYLFQWIVGISNILNELAEFIVTILLFLTPSWIIIITMMSLVVYINYIGGIEGIGRCSEVFGPIVSLLVIILVSLSIPNMELSRILPIYSTEGVTPIVKGAVPPLMFLGESVIMLVLLSFMDQPKNGPKAAIWGVGLSALLVTISTISVIFVFGATIASRLRFPAIDAIRFISFMEFIQNLEIIATIIWVLSVFIKLAVYFFLASYSTSQLFKLKDWRKSIWFIAIITLLLALIQPDVTMYGLEFLQRYWSPYALPLNMIGIPLLLLVVGSLRRRKERAKSAKGQTARNS